jgi:hypothetical protein
VNGKVTYYDDFGACRDGCARGHEGNDLMGAKLTPLVAAAGGKVSFLRTDASGTSGNMLTIKDDEGWTYVYIHVNNDTPGTDDGLNPEAWRFAPGIKLGSRVSAGDLIGYMGDSGNAENSGAHLHFEMHKPDGSAFSPYVSLRVSQGFATAGLCRFPTNPKATPNASANRGYWAVDNAGNVYAYGGAPFYGSRPPAPGAPAVVDVAPTATGKGYWIVDTRGDVTPFGDAVDYGDMAGVTLNGPIAGMTPTGTGKGYWLLGRDGGIFSFGDAAFHGSMGGVRLNAAVISMASTPSGLGYWLLGADGGIFSFGDAQFWGSTGGMTLAKPIVGIANTGTGGGYWLLGSDGGVFAFGDAGFKGSVPGTGWCAMPVSSAMTGTTTGKGYWVLTNDGRVLTFGDAVDYGQPSSANARPVALAGVPA